MICLKCGREIGIGQAFCKECLTFMEQHPVKSGTTVLLPNRSAVAAPRRSTHSRRIRKPEERIIRLKKLILIQSIAFLLVLTGFVVTVLLMSQQVEENRNTVLPGQNYSTVETTVKD